VTLKVWENAEHFMNQDSSLYKKEVTAKALVELVAFFKKNFQ